MGDDGPTPVELDSWDPSTIPDDACVLIIGSRHSGKSVLLTDIMWHKQKRLDVIVGMNPTESASDTLSCFTPPCFIYDEYSERALSELLEWQKRCAGVDKRARRRDGTFPPGYKPKTYKVGLVLDDCMAETVDGKKKRVMHSGDIETVFKLGRHFKLFFLCAMQYIKDAPPSIRGNVDYVFVFDTNMKTEMEKLYEEYFSMFPTYSDFYDAFRACVGEKYNCMVLDVRRSRGGAPGAGIFFYKAVNRIGTRFKVGRSAFWRLSDLYYADRADLSLDPSKIRGEAPASAPAPLAKPAGRGKMVIRRRTDDGEPVRR